MTSSQENRYPKKTLSRALSMGTSLAHRAVEVLQREGPGPFFRAISRKFLIYTGLRTRASLYPPVPNGKKLAPPFAKIDLSKDPFGGPVGFDIVCLPIIDWDYRFQRPQQLLARFAKKGNRVFYGSIDINPEASQPAHILKSMRILADRAWSFQFPQTIDHYDLYQQNITSEQILCFMESLDHLRRAAGITNAVLLVDFPNWLPLALEARKRFGWKIIYDCMEDHCGFSELPTTLVEENEIELAKSADLVLAVSDKITERMQSYNRNVVNLPNAADFAHFRYPIQASDPFIHIHHPVIGYIGVITEWFDMDLVYRAAQIRLDWNFVLIGEVFNVDTEAIKALPNVFFLDEQPYQSLPGFANFFDVAMIPHKRVRRTEWAGSVKLYEYMSTGRPVVATPLSWMQPLKDIVYLADTPEDFVAAVARAMQEDNPERYSARLAFALKNTWDRRVEEIYEHSLPLFPKASIIILTHNNLDVTKMCLDSIREKTDYPNFEVVFVDNASTDGTPEFLMAEQAKDKRLKVILNEKNLGFAAGNNQGIEAASGDYIVLLNNDTIVTSGWLSKLITHLQDPTVGAAGPVTNMSGNESRIPVPYQTIEDIHSFARAYCEKHEGLTFDIQVLTMFCVVLRREVIDQVGLLDTRYGMGMFEDDDYAYRLRQSGYRLICAEDVFVHHFGNVSFKQYGQDLYQRLLEENRKKFEDKWGIQWEPHKARSQS